MGSPTDTRKKCSLTPRLPVTGMIREHQSWYTNVISYIIGFNPYLKAEIETMQVLYLPYRT